jgi:hypothetical protein
MRPTPPLPPLLPPAELASSSGAARAGAGAGAARGAAVVATRARLRVTTPSVANVKLAGGRSAGGLARCAARASVAKRKGAGAVSGRGSGRRGAAAGRPSITRRLTGRALNLRCAAIWSTSSCSDGL